MRGGRVRIKVLSRSTKEHTQEIRGDLFRAVHNPDSALHPFEREREYVRALNATKLDKVFAKPFLGALAGHYDGVVCMAKHPSSLATLVTADMCGELRAWHVASLACTSHAAAAHSGWIRGIAFASPTRLLSCGDDRAIREWEYPLQPQPLATTLGHNQFTGLDVMRDSSDAAVFATSGGNVVELWDRNRSDPVRTFEWGSESVHSVRFNPVETQLLASSAGDRSVALYDVRAGTALHKVVLVMRTNAIAWNPLEAFHFTCACEDTNLYTFDMRNLKYTKCVHEGHVAAVMDVDYAPTGREFVSGSYDRSVRIWETDSVRSRDVYTAPRMQRIFCVRFTDDARFVLSGSDDANVRVWKARASEPMRMMSRREQAKLDYNERLKRRFAQAPEIRRIAQFHRVPKLLLSLRRRTDRHNAGVRRKHQNESVHSRRSGKPVVFKTHAEAPVVATLS